MAYRKPLILAIIAAFGIVMGLVGESGAAGWLVFGFLLYLAFGES